MVTWGTLPTYGTLEGFQSYLAAET